MEQSVQKRKASDTRLLPSWSFGGIYQMTLVFVCGCGIAFLLIATLALRNDHVSIYFPFVCDLGAFPPESNIFSAVCGAVSIVVAFFNLMVFMVIDTWNPDRDERISTLNTRALVCGFMTAAGVFLVGAAPLPSYPNGHGTGAMLAIGGATFYAYVHVQITHRLCPKYFSLSTYKIRSALVKGLILVWISLFIFMFVGAYQYDMPTSSSYFGKKAPGDPWFVVMLSFGVGHYILLTSLLVYLSTFYPVLKKIIIYSAVEYSEKQQNIFCERTTLSKS